MAPSQGEGKPTVEALGKMPESIINLIITEHWQFHLHEKSVVCTNFKSSLELQKRNLIHCPENCLNVVVRCHLEKGPIVKDPFLGSRKPVAVINWGLCAYHQ
jgi:hypothetical protein